MKLILFTFTIVWTLLKAKTTPYLSDVQPFVSTTVCQTKECLAKGQSLKSNLKPSVEPCDDFYSFACGGWEESHTITNNLSVNVFQVVQKEIINSVKQSMSKKSSASDPESVVFASELFKTCMNMGKF